MMKSIAFFIIYRTDLYIILNNIDRIWPKMKYNKTNLYDSIKEYAFSFLCLVHNFHMNENFQYDCVTYSS